MLRSGPTCLIPSSNILKNSDSESLLNFELECRAVSENVLAKPDFKQNNTLVKSVFDITKNHKKRN